MANFFGIMARPLGYVLSGLYLLIGNYAVALIILTVIVKVILYPFYKRQMLSTAGMGDITPRMNEIRNKYASDPQKMNEEMQKLYKEEGMSPTSGCLPMFVQMFIIMGLFALLRNPLNYINSQEMVFAIHESFLWIKDLSQPDPWILPILTGVATYGASFMNTAMMQSQTQAMGQGSGKGMQFVMKYLFPIMIIWLSKTYAAGLSIYWFLSQLIQIFYNFRFNVLRKRIVEERKNRNKKTRKPVRAGQGVR
ncbi:MAG: YidC/Oxa1 family membrane protein insertase [Eubacteriales bacterium]|nr:YidC/Oxa1 family membrane protein insertase [Eubacteriales bacterium]